MATIVKKTGSTVKITGPAILEQAELNKLNMLKWTATCRRLEATFNMANHGCCSTNQCIQMHVIQHWPYRRGLELRCERSTWRSSHAVYVGARQKAFLDRLLTFGSSHPASLTTYTAIIHSLLRGGMHRHD
jgi:hypothetical protein